MIKTRVLCTSLTLLALCSLLPGSSSSPSATQKVYVQVVDGRPEITSVLTNASSLDGNALYTDARSSILKTPSDARYSEQWGYARAAVPEAAEVATGKEVVVAVLDTGVDAAHEDLAGKVLPGFSVYSTLPTTDPNGHGTHVAGIIAATSDNQVGVAGVAPDVKILPVQVLDKTGFGYDSDIARGVIWAADHGADVINMSLGSTEDTEAFRLATQYAVSKGSVVVAAAGNSAMEGNPLMYPAGYPDVVGVGAAGALDSHAMFSETNSSVDIAAPGVAILSSWPGNAYRYESGTSMAAPFVAGGAALVLAHEPNLSGKAVAARLMSSAQDIGEKGRDDSFGAGMLDAYAAVMNLSPRTPSSLPKPVLTPPTLDPAKLPVLPGFTPPNKKPLLDFTLPSLNTKNMVVLTSSAPGGLTYGDALTLSVKVYGKELSPLDSQDITLYTRESASEEWKVAGVGNTARTGEVKFRANPGSSAEYYAGSGESKSQTVRVDLKNHLSLKRSGERLQGVMSPTGRVELQRLDKKGWVAVIQAASPYAFAAPSGIWRVCAVNASTNCSGVVR